MTLRSPQDLWTQSITYSNIWVNYNDLTATSLGIMVSKGNHPQMALIQGPQEVGGLNSG